MKQILQILLLLLVCSVAWGQNGRVHTLTGPDTTVVATRAYADTKEQIVSGTPTKDSSITKIYRDVNENSIPKIVDSKTQSVKKIAFDKETEGIEEISQYNGFWDETIRLLHNRGAYRITSVPSTTVDSLFIIEVNSPLSDNWLYHSEENSQTDNASQVSGLGATWIATGMTTTNDVLLNKEGRKTADMHILTSTVGNFNVKFDNPDTIFAGDSIFFSIDVLLGESDANKNITIQLRDNAPSDFANTSVPLDSSYDKWQTISTYITLLSDLPRGQDVSFRNKFYFRITGDIGDTLYTSRAEMTYRAGQYKRTEDTPVLTTDKYYAEYEVVNSSVYLDELQPMNPYLSDNDLVQSAIDYCAYNNNCRFIYTGNKEISEITLHGNVILVGNYRKHNTDDYGGLKEGTTITVNTNDNSKDALTLENLSGGSSAYDAGPGIFGIKFNVVSDVRGVINVNRSFGNTLEHIFVDGNNFAKFGIGSEYDFTESPGIQGRINKFDAIACDYGGYFPRWKGVFSDCVFKGNQIGFSTGGNRIEFDRCWFEDNAGSAIEAYIHPEENLFDQVRLNDSYFENNAASSNGVIMRFSDVDKLSITNCVINSSGLTDTLITLNNVRNADFTANEISASVYQYLWEDDSGIQCQISFCNNYIRGSTTNSFLQTNPTIQRDQLTFCSNTSLSSKSRNVYSDVNARRLDSETSEADSLYFGGEIFVNNDTLNPHYENLSNWSDSITFLSNVNYTQTGRTVNPWGDSISNVIAVTATQTTASNYFGIKLGESLQTDQVYTLSIYGKLLNDTVQAPANASYRYFQVNGVTGKGGTLGPFNHNEWQEYSIHFIPNSSTDTLTVQGLAFVSGDTFALSSIHLESGWHSTRYIETNGTYTKQLNPKLIPGGNGELVLEGDLQVTGTLTADPSYFLTTGTATPTTDVSGQFNITHGLGVEPTHLDIGNKSATEYHFKYTCGSTNCTVTVTDGAGTNTVVPSTAISISWAAFR